MTPARNRTAERIYRQAWHAWLMNPCLRKFYEAIMDNYQPEIADTPQDPRWQRFADSLPGYREFWERAKDEGLAAVNRKFGGNDDTSLTN